MYDIEFYEDINGKSEIYEYIKELKGKNNKENKQKAKRLLEDYKKRSGEK